MVGLFADTDESLDYRDWAEQIARLSAAVDELIPIGFAVGAASPGGSEWYELLRRKLLPQASGDPLLVVALVGGTNIGKSLLFNHLAGEVASAVSPLAAGTRHPVCLVPPNLADSGRLARLLTPFQVTRWQSPADPLEDHAEHKLFWRVGKNVPDDLLLLDTPDIDSDVEVNWQRADCVRQASDVLVAVLTQQKYNDAAVKRFFRKAVEADKPIIVVFNQCDLEHDAEYWPQWLATFASETGARPELVYVVPLDRAAAAERRLPFYEVGPEATQPLAAARSLRDDLARLHFARIKIRTFRGALERVADPAAGLPAYLHALRHASERFRSAAELLSSAEMARIRWPMLPARLLVDEIRGWWQSHRAPWSRRIHGFYRVLGQQVSRPVKGAWTALKGERPDPLRQFHARERETVVLAVQQLLDELERLSHLGNETLRPRLAQLLAGDARQRLLADIQAAHAALPAMDDDYRAFVCHELDLWGQQNPRAISLLRSLDQVSAIARPAITVSLAVSGWVVAGGLVHDVAVQAAGHTATQIATEAAITGGITGSGEAVLSTTGEGLRYAAARLFRRLQSGYAERRASWLADWLDQHLLGSLLADLRAGAEIPRSDAFRQVEQALAALEAKELHAAQIR